MKASNCRKIVQGLDSITERLSNMTMIVLNFIKERVPRKMKDVHDCFVTFLCFGGCLVNLFYFPVTHHVHAWIQ